MGYTHTHTHTYIYTAFGKKHKNDINSDVYNHANIKSQKYFYGKFGNGRIVS